MWSSAVYYTEVFSCMIYHTLKKGQKQENLLQVASSLSQWWKFGTHFGGAGKELKMAITKAFQTVLS